MISNLCHLFQLRHCKLNFCLLDLLSQPFLDNFNPDF